MQQYFWMLACKEIWFSPFLEGSFPGFLYPPKPIISKFQFNLDIHVILICV